MPAGRLAEAGFAGVWRIIEAKPAPSTKLRKLTLTGKDVPLLEFAVEFAEGGVKGPPPLSCSDAKSSSSVTYRGGALAARLQATRMEGWQKVNVSAGKFPPTASFAAPRCVTSTSTTMPIW